LKTKPEKKKKRKLNLEKIMKITTRPLILPMKPIKVKTLGKAHTGW
jgi:hypothetical protein